MWRKGLGKHGYLLPAMWAETKGGKGMSDVKRCVQCGILKEEEEFRKYTYSRENGTEGRYRVCKSCEAINAAYRRAKQYIVERERSENSTWYDKMVATVDKTDKLYAILESRGLRVPASKQEESTDSIDNLLAFYKEDAKVTVAVTPQEAPDELQHWLTVDTQEWKKDNISPEYLQETVYESLKAKYRPQVGVNKETFVPIYDDTFKAVLNQILRRFDDYEEECSLDDND
jgi:hypothetical protein